MNCKNTISSMLTNNYALEKNAKDLFEKFAKESGDDLPEVTKIYEEWAEVADRHSMQLDKILEEMGEDASSMKELSNKAMSGIMDISIGKFPDENIKNSVIAHGIGHLAAGGYMGTKAIANKCEMVEVADMAEEFANDCKEYADKISMSIPEMVAFIFENEGENQE